MKLAFKYVERKKKLKQKKQTFTNLLCAPFINQINQTDF